MDLEMEGSVISGSGSPVIRFTPLHSVFAATGFSSPRGEAFGRLIRTQNLELKGLIDAYSVFLSIIFIF